MIASRTIRLAALGAVATALALALSSAPAAARTTTAVGDASVVVESVTGALPNKIRTLAIEDVVFEGEAIRTGPASATRIRLLDGATLTMGANSGAVVTSVASAPDSGVGRFALTTTVGVFKFEGASSASYEIRTPVATIDARDAVFTLAIDADGTTTVILHSGEMTLANLVGDSLTMRAPGLSTTIAPPAPGAAPPPPSQPALPPQATTARIEAMNRAVSRYARTIAPSPMTSSEADSAETSPEMAAFDAEALARFAEIFAQTDGSPEAIADLAEKLIGEIEDDPLAAANTATLIGEAASQALNTRRFAPVVIADGFALSPRSIGWDFGPVGSPLHPGFRRVTPENLTADGPPLRGVQFASGGALFSDGIMNVRLFGASVRNGTYRLLVLTDDLSDQAKATRPLGHTIVINDTPTPIAAFSAVDGARMGYLAQPEVRTADLSGNVYAPPEGEPDGIVAVLTVEVTNGGFTVSLLAEDDEETYIAGLILEPIDEPSALYPEGLFPDGERILAAEAQIANAIGGLLEKVAAAAGDPETRRRLLDLPGTPIQNVTAVSES